MRTVKHVMTAFSLGAFALALVYGVYEAGGQGIFTLVMCLVPAALGILTTVLRTGFSRPLAAVSAVAMLIAAMKTSVRDSPLENIMLVAFFGMVFALVLVIVPDKRRD
jgi:ABC-type Fe3+-siderophore transport system permease subunit